MPPCRPRTVAASPLLLAKTTGCASRSCAWVSASSDGELVAARATALIAGAGGTAVAGGVLNKTVVNKIVNEAGARPLRRELGQAWRAARERVCAGQQRGPITR